MKRWSAQGATTIVTGASSGIGAELSKLLAGRGARVIAVARRNERLQPLADWSADQSGQIIPVAGDITDADFRQRVIEHVTCDGAKHLDLLVNNAGIGGIGRFDLATESRMRRIMEVNFFAPVELTRLALPLLKQSVAENRSSAVICNISSVLAHRAVPDKSEYCASKFALHGWSDALRAELADSRVQVTLVSPSTTASEFFSSTIETPASLTKHNRSAMKPEHVAAITLRAIERRQDERIISVGGHLLVYCDRMWPWLANRLVARWG